MKRIAAFFIVFSAVFSPQPAHANHGPHARPDGGLSHGGPIKTSQARILAETLSIALGPHKQICPYHCRGATLRIEAEYQMRTDADQAVTVQAAFPILSPGRWEMEKRIQVTLDGKSVPVQKLDLTSDHESLRPALEKVVQAYIDRRPELKKLLSVAKLHGAEGQMEHYVSQKLGIPRSKVAGVLRFVLKSSLQMQELYQLVNILEPTYHHPLAQAWGFPVMTDPMEISLYSYTLTFQPETVYRVHVMYEGLTTPTFSYPFRPATHWAGFENLTLRVALPAGCAYKTNLPLKREAAQDQILLQGFFKKPPDDLQVRYGTPKETEKVVHTQREGFTPKHEEHLLPVLRQYAKAAQMAWPQAIEPALTEKGLSVSLLDKDAVTPFAKLPWSEALPWLWEKAGSRDSDLRRQAVHAIGLAPEKYSVYPLVLLLKHSDFWVRYQAECALERITGQRFSPVPGEIEPETAERWLVWLKDSKHGQMQNWLSARIDRLKKAMPIRLERLKDETHSFEGDPLAATTEAELFQRLNLLPQRSKEWKAVVERWAADSYPTEGTGYILMWCSNEAWDRLIHRLRKEKKNLTLLTAGIGFLRQDRPRSTSLVQMDLYIDVLNLEEAPPSLKRQAIFLLRDRTGLQMQKLLEDIWVRDDARQPSYGKPFTKEELAERARVIQAWNEWYRESRDRLRWKPNPRKGGSFVVE